MRFPSLANLLMARGGSWVLRPDALRRVYLRARPDVSARPQRGPAAGVPVLVFTSFTCPWCGKQNEVLRQIDDHRPVRWQFMHFLREPERDVPLAIASECAFRRAGEEAFWAMFDELFAARPASREALEETFSRVTGLSAETLGECATDSGLMARIAKDHAIAERLGIAVTPATAVGPILLTGLVEAPAMELWMDRALARTGGNG
ncbi:thioredoxin domain-containing protein [bacterium]|nr:thioredoxin domain-containing protein [bacterium]